MKPNPVDFLLNEFTFFLKSLVKLNCVQKVMEVGRNNIRLPSLKGGNVITVKKRGAVSVLAVVSTAALFPPGGGLVFQVCIVEMCACTEELKLAGGCGSA